MKNWKKGNETPNALSYQRILDSAIAVFSEKGFEGARMRDIAARADIAHAMINYYFACKQSLWEAAVASLFERMGPILRPSEEDIARLGDDPRQFLKTMVYRYVRFCAQNPDYARIIIQETGRDTDRLRWIVNNHIKQLHTDVRNLARIGVETGVFPQASPTALSYILIGACQMIYAMSPEAKLTWGRDVSSEETMEEHIDTLMALFFRPSGNEKS